MSKYLGKVRYIGPNIGIDGLFDNKVYKVVGIDGESGALRIIDESGDDYLYSPTKPKLLSEAYKGGKFVIVEDDINQSLKNAILIAL